MRLLACLGFRARASSLAALGALSVIALLWGPTLVRAGEKPIDSIQNPPATKNADAEDSIIDMDSTDFPFPRRTARIVTYISDEKSNNPTAIYYPGNLDSGKRTLYHTHLTVENSDFRGIVGTGIIADPDAEAMIFPYSNGTNEVITLRGDISFGFIATGGKRDNITLDTSSLTFLGSYDCSVVLAGVQNICAGDNGPSDGDTLSILRDITPMTSDPNPVATMFSVSGFSITDLIGNVSFENSGLGYINLLKAGGNTLSLASSHFKTLTGTGASDTITITGGTQFIALNAGAGGDVISITGNAKFTTIDTGAGNDNLTINAGRIEFRPGRKITNCDGTTGAFHLCGGAGAADVLTIGATETGSVSRQNIYNLWTEANFDGYWDEEDNEETTYLAGDDYAGTHRPSHTGVTYRYDRVTRTVVYMSGRQPIDATGLILEGSGLVQTFSAVPLSVAGFERVRLTSALTFTNSFFGAVELISTTGTTGPSLSLIGTNALNSILGGDGNDTIYLGTRLDGNSVRTVIRFNGNAPACGRICGGSGRDTLIFGSEFTYTGTLSAAGFEATTFHGGTYRFTNASLGAVTFIGSTIIGGTTLTLSGTNELHSIMGGIRDDRVTLLAGTILNFTGDGINCGTATGLVRLCGGGGNDTLLILGNVTITLPDNTLSMDDDSEEDVVSSSTDLARITGQWETCISTTAGFATITTDDTTGACDTLVGVVNKNLADVEDNGAYLDITGTINDDTKILNDVRAANVNLLAGADDLTFHGGAYTGTISGGPDNDALELRGGIYLGTISGGAGNDTISLLLTIILGSAVDMGEGDNALWLGATQDTKTTTLNYRLIGTDVPVCGAGRAHMCAGSGTSDVLHIGNDVSLPEGFSIKGFETSNFYGTTRDRLHRFTDSDLGVVVFNDDDPSPFNSSGLGNKITLSGTSTLTSITDNANANAVPQPDQVSLYGRITLGSFINLGVSGAGRGGDVLAIGYDVHALTPASQTTILTLSTAPRSGTCQAHFCGGANSGNDLDTLILGNDITYAGTTTVKAIEFGRTIFHGGTHHFADSGLGVVRFTGATNLTLSGTNALHYIEGSSGNDRITLLANSILNFTGTGVACGSKTVRLCGGEGDGDRLVIEEQVSPSAISVAGFETTELGGGSRFFSGSELGRVLVRTGSSGFGSINLGGTNTLNYVQFDATSLGITSLVLESDADISFAKAGGSDCDINKDGNQRFCGFFASGGVVYREDGLGIDSSSRHIDQVHIISGARANGAVIDPRTTPLFSGIERLQLDGFESLGALTLGSSGSFGQMGPVHSLTLTGRRSAFSITGTSGNDYIALAGNASLKAKRDAISGGDGEDWLYLNANSRIGFADFDPTNSTLINGFERLTLSGFTLGSADSPTAITLGTGPGVFDDDASGATNAIRFLEFQGVNFYGSITGSDEADIIMISGGTAVLDYIDGAGGDDRIVLGRDSDGNHVDTVIRFNATNAVEICDGASGMFRICGGAGEDTLVIASTVEFTVTGIDETLASITEGFENCSAATGLAVAACKASDDVIEFTTSATGNTINGRSGSDLIYVSGAPLTLRHIIAGPVINDGDDFVYLGINRDGANVPTTLTETGRARCNNSRTARICGGGGTDRLVVNGAASIFGEDKFNPLGHNLDAGNPLVSGFEIIELRNFKPIRAGGTQLNMAGNLEELVLISGRDVSTSDGITTYTNRQDIDLGDAGAIFVPIENTDAQRIYLIGVNIGDVSTSKGDDRVLIAGKTDLNFGSTGSSIFHAVNMGEGDDIVILGGTYDDVYGDLPAIQRVDGAGGDVLETNISLVVGGSIGGGAGTDVLVLEGAPKFNFTGGVGNYGRANLTGQNFPVSGFETLIVRGGNYGNVNFGASSGHVSTVTTLSLEDAGAGAIAGAGGKQTLYISGDVRVSGNISLYSGNDEVVIGKALANDGTTTSSKATTLTFTSAGTTCSGMSAINLCGGGDTSDRLVISENATLSGMRVAGFRLIEIGGGNQAFSGSALGKTTVKTGSGGFGSITLRGTNTLNYMQFDAASLGIASIILESDADISFSDAGGGDCDAIKADNQRFCGPAATGGVSYDGDGLDISGHVDVASIAFGARTGVMAIDPTNTPLFSGIEVLVLDGFTSLGAITLGASGSFGTMGPVHSLTLTGTSAATSITGTAENDYIELAASVSDTTSAISGGDGEDWLSLDASSRIGGVAFNPKNLAPISGFERLTLENFIIGSSGSGVDIRFGMEPGVFGDSSGNAIRFLEIENSIFHGSLTGSDEADIMLISGGTAVLDYIDAGDGDDRIVLGQGNSAIAEDTRIIFNASGALTMCGGYPGTFRLCGGTGEDVLVIASTVTFTFNGTGETLTSTLGGFEDCTQATELTASHCDGPPAGLPGGTGTAGNDRIDFTPSTSGSAINAMAGDDLIYVTGAVTLSRIVAGPQTGDGNDFVYLGIDQDGANVATTITATGGGCQGSARLCGGSGSDRLVVNGAATIFGEAKFNPLGNRRTTGNPLVNGFEIVEMRNFQPASAVQLNVQGNFQELALISGRDVSGTNYTNRQDINLGNSGAVFVPSDDTGAQKAYLIGVSLGDIAMSQGNDTVLIAGKTDIKRRDTTFPSTKRAVDMGQGNDTLILGGSYDDVYGDLLPAQRVDGAGGPTLETKISLVSGGSMSGHNGTDVLVLAGEPQFNFSGGSGNYARATLNNGSAFPARGFETLILRGGTYGNVKIGTANNRAGLVNRVKTLSLEDVATGTVTGGGRNDTVYLSGTVAVNYISLGRGNDRIVIGKRLENNGSTTTDKETRLNFTGNAGCSGSFRICAAGTDTNTLIIANKVKAITINGSDATLATTVESRYTTTDQRPQRQSLPDSKIDVDKITLSPSGSRGYASGFENLVFEFDIQLENALIPAVQSITRDLVLSALRQDGVYSGQRQLEGYQSATMKSFLAPDLTAEASYEQEIAISEHGVGRTLWQSESGSQNLKAGGAVHVLSGELSSGEEVYEISGQASGVYLAYEVYALTMQAYALGAWFDIADTNGGSKTHHETIAEGTQLLFGGRVAFDVTLRGLTLTPSATIFWQDTDMDADYVYLGREETTGMVALNAAWGSGSLRAGLAYDDDYATYEGGTQHYQAEPAAVMGFSQEIPSAAGMELRLEADWRRGLDTGRESGNVRLTGALAF